MKHWCAKRWWQVCVMMGRLIPSSTREGEREQAWHILWNICLIVLSVVASCKDSATPQPYPLLSVSAMILSTILPNPDRMFLSTSIPNLILIWENLKVNLFIIINISWIQMTVLGYVTLVVLFTIYFHQTFCLLTKGVLGTVLRCPWCLVVS